MNVPGKQASIFNMTEIECYVWDTWDTFNITAISSWADIEIDQYVGYKQTLKPRPKFDVRGSLFNQTPCFSKIGLWLNQNRSGHKKLGLNRNLTKFLPSSVQVQYQFSPIWTET